MEAIVKYKDIHLVLFLSRATPLSRWQQMGIFEREVLIYKRLSAHLNKVSIVTSGGLEELKFEDDLNGINILCNRWRLSPNFYSLLAPWLHRTSLKNATLFKSNQLDGAWTAILAGKLVNKPVIVRAGYLWAKNFLRTNPPNMKSYLIEKIETFSILQADAIAVTTSSMRRFISRKFGIDTIIVNIIPNYVDTELFRPLEKITKIRGRICYVGRLTYEKNLKLLIKAVAGLNDVSLQLIGKGPSRHELENLAKNIKQEILFSGTIENADLPDEINRAEIFILPSKFEGHPKALIEAMACGSAVIGTNVEGIRDVIQHNRTGILCEPDVEEICKAIEKLRDNGNFRQKLGQNARRFVLEKYSLDRIVENELNVYKSVIGNFNNVGGDGSI